jgi:hypothetical protein
MASASKYQMFTLLGNEFTFDVDVSKLGLVHTCKREKGNAHLHG